jgi:hypothetical protein
MRRTNARGRDEDESMGDTLTTLTTGSSVNRWSRRGNGFRGRNSRGEAAAAGTGRRCIVDICLVGVLGVVLLAKFGSVEMQLQGNINKLRGHSDAPQSTTDGAAYAQWLVRQSKIAEHENDETMPVKFNNDHDAAEEFFNQAVNNLKNGLPQIQINDTGSDSIENSWQQQQPELGQSQDQLALDSSQQQNQREQLGQQLDQNTQSLGGIMSQYDSAKPAQLNSHFAMDPQQSQLQDGSMQRAPEFQNFEQASIQHQLQQSNFQQQQQQLQHPVSGGDPLHPNAILDTNQQQLNHLMAEASDHGEDLFKLNAQLIDGNAAMGAASNQAPMMNSPHQLPQQPITQDQLIAAGVAGGVIDLHQSPVTNRQLQVATWNIAAINNNPFEYWITYDENPEYEKIMTAIENFLEDPGDKDVAVSNVFTEEMFTQLEKRMDEVGWDNVRKFWEGDFKNRKIISGFMKVSCLNVHLHFAYSKMRQYNTSNG